MSDAEDIDMEAEEQREALLDLQYVAQSLRRQRASVSASKAAVLPDEPREARRRALIRITPQRKRVADKACRALTSRHNLYHREGRLVRVCGTENDAPRIDVLPNPSLGEELTEAAKFVKRNADGVSRRVHPPDWLIGCVASRGEWPMLRELRGVVEAPILRRDGTILQEPGYDPSTRLLYLPSVQFPAVPKTPTYEDARAACDKLLDLVCDFPFAQPVHKAAWLAGMLTGFARHAYQGYTPFFLIDGNVRGSGKSMVVDVAAIIMTGRVAPRNTHSFDEVEEEKRITSTALQGDALVLIDNIRHPFGSGVFDCALTGEEWRGRVLATNQMPRVRLSTIWWGTGNNVRFRNGVDTARRTLHIRFESNEANPERRQDFKYPLLLEHVKAHRRELAVAALTMLSAYLTVGQAEGLKLKRWGSFEGWSQLVRSCVYWLTQLDPYEAHEALAQADQTTSALEGLLLGWRELCEEQRVEECSTRQVVEWLAEDDEYKRSSPGHRLRFQYLRTALSDLLPSARAAQLDVRRLGELLGSIKDRPLGGLRLRSGKRTMHGMLWRVETSSAAE